MASSTSTAVEHSPLNPKDGGLSPATTIGTRGQDSMIILNPNVS